MPWPIGRLPMVAPEYLSSGRTWPICSPGRSTPVALPKPNRWIHLSNGLEPPRAPAIFTAPMFDECLRISLTVIEPTVGVRVHRRDREARLGRDLALFQRRGDGEGLEGRARLVVRGHGTVG